MNYSSQTINSTEPVGILLVDSNRKIVSINGKFIKMWGLPEHLVNSDDERLALEFAYFQLKNPKSFLKKIQNVYTHMELNIHDTIKLKDGRRFERYSEPQWLEDKIVARIWIFREISGWNIKPDLPIIENKILPFPICCSFN